MTLVKKTFVAMLAASAIGSAQAGVLLADSVADFSGTQGANSWYYYGYDNNDLVLLNQFDGESWSKAADPFYGQVGLWADRGVFAVRRWVSETTGSVRIAGVLGCVTSCGDAVVGGISVNGVDVWGYATPGVFETTFSFDTVLHQGDLVDFHLNAYYVTKFNATITAVPEPETYAMFLAGLGILGAVARRKKIV